MKKFEFKWDNRYEDKLFGIYCNIDNFFEALDTWRWCNTKKVIKCRVCGMKMIPALEGCGPKSAGWQQLKNGGFVCHCCLEHSYDVVSKEWQEHVKYNNDYCKRLVEEYKENKLSDKRKN